MSPILGIWASSKATTAADTGAMFPLQVITVGAAGASSVTFTNIPGTYSHLQVRALVRTSHAAVIRNLGVRINSDSGSNYANHVLQGNGSAASASADTSITYSYIGIAAGANANSNVFGANVIDILDYANTNKYKTLRNLNGVDNNGDGSVFLKSGLWQSTSAITSLSFSIEGGANITQYSQFALYGVKSA